MNLGRQALFLRSFTTHETANDGLMPHRFKPLVRTSVVLAVVRRTDI